MNTLNKHAAAAAVRIRANAQEVLAVRAHSTLDERADIFTANCCCHRRTGARAQSAAARAHNWYLPG
jgi:hypothetical protein